MNSNSVRNFWFCFLSDFTLSVQAHFSCSSVFCCGGTKGRPTSMRNESVDGEKWRGRPKATWLDDIKLWTALRLTDAMSNEKLGLNF